MARAQASRPGMARWLVVALLVVALDQAGKWWVLQHFRLGEALAVTPFFNLTLAYNRGAAFSFLAGAGGWQRWFFTLLALAAAVFIVVLLRSHARQRLFAFALSLILGGALGNAIDRLVHGHVVDFLDFHWQALAPLFYRGHYPAFNLADAAITAGVVCLIVDELLRVRRSRSRSRN